MYYAQFYYMGKDGHYREALGSDQICHVDGRKTLQNMCEEARDYAQRIRRVHKFDGFAIFVGDIRNNRVLTTIHEIRWSEEDVAS